MKDKVDDTTLCLYALKYCTPVMFARFVCALFSFRARNFPAKSETQEPGKIIVECTSYDSDDGCYEKSKGYLAVKF